MFPRWFLCGPILTAISASIPSERRVLLIGMMCSGKSTVARSLGPLLGLPVIDLDRLIEARVGPLLPYVQHEGEQAFRELESEILNEILQGPSAVISTGGGTPCFDDRVARMKAAGTVIWLDVGFDVLLERIERAGGDRPLLFGLKGEPLRERVAQLVREREPFYAQCHWRVDAADAPARVAARIADLLNGQLR